MNDREELLIILQRLGREDRYEEVLARDATSFEDGFMVSLDLGMLELDTLPLGIFDNLQKLNYLDLGLNDIHSLPNGMFDFLPNLEFLNISGNRLKTLPMGIFNTLPNLKALGLRNNEIKELNDEIFQGLQKLTHLNLAGNNFNNLPRSIEKLNHLEELSTGENPLLIEDEDEI